jgi:DNA gyrase subunit A
MVPSPIYITSPTSSAAPPLPHPHVPENGFGRRTDVDAYRLQSCGGKNVISMKTTPKIGKVSAINLVDDTHRNDAHLPVRKIIRIDTKTIRSSGRNTSGVKLDADDKVAAALVVPPEDPKTPTRNGTVLQ